MDEDIVSQCISLAPECCLFFLWTIFLDIIHTNVNIYGIKIIIKHCIYLVFLTFYLLLVILNHKCIFVLLSLCICVHTSISIYHLLIFLTFRHVNTCFYKIVLAYSIMYRHPLTLVNTASNIYRETHRVIILTGFFSNNLIKQYYLISNFTFKIIFDMTTHSIKIFFFFFFLLTVVYYSFLWLLLFITTLGLKQTRLNNCDSKHVELCMWTHTEEFYCCICFTYESVLSWKSK